MTKRSKSLQKTIDQINEILKNEYIVTMDQNGEMLNASSDSAEGVAFKDGLATALEVLLHRYDSYRGFIYTKDKRHERKYY